MTGSMMTGSMIIPNSLGGGTILVLDKDGKTSASPEDNALNEARAALRREKGNASGREGNVRFLTEWIRLAETPVVPPPVVKVNYVLPKQMELLEKSNEEKNLELLQSRKGK